MSDHRPDPDDLAAELDRLRAARDAAGLHGLVETINEIHEELIDLEGPLDQLPPPESAEYRHRIISVRSQAAEARDRIERADPTAGQLTTGVWGET